MKRLTPEAFFFGDWKIEGDKLILAFKERDSAEYHMISYSDEYFQLTRRLYDTCLKFI